MSVFVSNMASMIGIGVAVDYSLFVLARYREEVRGRREPEAARARAMATSGVAVAFSGMTVIVVARRAVARRRDRAALDGARRDPRRRGVGARGRDAAAGAAVADGAARRRAGPDRRRRAASAPAPRRRGRARAGDARSAFWARGPARVMRRPVLSVAGAAAVLLALAAPGARPAHRQRRAAPVPGGERDARGLRGRRARDRAGARPRSRSSSRASRPRPRVASPAPTPRPRASWRPWPPATGAARSSTVVPRHDGESDAGKAS